ALVCWHLIHEIQIVIFIIKNVGLMNQTPTQYKPNPYKNK
ncbi:unnamed protein product, partial [marine sediment metagenome]